MIPKRERNNSKFFLKVRARGTWVKWAGTSEDGNGKTRPAAETTRHMSEAQGFKTIRQAMRMRDLLYDRYSMKTDIIRYEGGQLYDW